MCTLVTIAISKSHSEALYVIFCTRQFGVRELIIRKGAIHLLLHHWPRC